METARPSGEGCGRLITSRLPARRAGCARFADASGAFGVCGVLRPVNSGVAGGPGRGGERGSAGVLRTDELDYHLPPELIATRAVEPRDAARLMVLKRSDPGFCEHRTVRDMPGYLSRGDLLVFNRTSVIPARLSGVRVGTGGRVGGLFLRAGSAPDRWVVLLRAGHLKPGARVALLGSDGGASGVELELVERVADEAGAWEVRVLGVEGRAGLEVLDRVGLTPLPPYILQQRKERGEAVADAEDRARYQTVVADASESGSVAAPTAGLHFTPGLLGELAAGGVERASVVLHVGTGTFKPVESETVEAHPMHSEWCSVDGETLGRVKGATGRVIAVGTTAARALESYAGWEGEHPGEAAPGWMQTRILITPGYRWGFVGGMVTNFHLPRSTLMAMIAALLEPEGGGAGVGVSRLVEAYREAVSRGYRFYSYGDAMLILP